MKDKSLSIGQSFSANLLIPWKTIIPIKIKIEKKELLTINNKKIPTLKANIEIDAFFGQFLPKSHLWITEEKPHMLVKQKSFDKSYERISNDSLSEETLALFNE
jgi:hypothetical protein